MTETDIECGHTKTTLYARGFNKSCKMITFSHLNSINFKYNFKELYVGKSLVNIGRINPIIFAILVFHYLYVWERC